jgi:hypothetical protein
MLRRVSTFVILIAALTVAEPLLHNHPLQQKSIPEACAICATGVTPLPHTTPTVSAPCVVVYTLTAEIVPVVISSVEVAIPSRAPPA